jgi:hypothetical protein
MPSSAPTVGTPAIRCLRAVPIRGLLSGDHVQAFMAIQQQRKKKNNDINTNESRLSVIAVVADSSVQRILQDGATQSEFGLEVGLQGINGISINHSSDGGSFSAIAIAAVVSIFLADGCAVGFWFTSNAEAARGQRSLLTSTIITTVPVVPPVVSPRRTRASAPPINGAVPGMCRSTRCVGRLDAQSPRFHLIIHSQAII